LNPCEWEEEEVEEGDVGSDVDDVRGGVDGTMGDV